jgi:DNA replication protein DnaC
MDTPQVLLDHHLKTLRLPTFLRDYDKVAQQCAAEGVDFPRYLLRLSELELLDRERRASERRIRQAKFDVVKSLDTFDFLAIPPLNKSLVLDLARCEFIERKENILALENSGTGKTHIALALGLAACQKGFRVRFTTAASLAHELIEAKDERRLMRFQKMLSSFELLIIDELGFVPLSKTGAEPLFEVFSRRYERSATLVTSNLPSTNGPKRSDPERLTGALLDRLAIMSTNWCCRNGPRVGICRGPCQRRYLLGRRRLGGHSEKAYKRLKPKSQNRITFFRSAMNRRASDSGRGVWAIRPLLTSASLGPALLGGG